MRFSDGLGGGTTQTIRNRNIDLLKLIAILLICISHSVPYGIGTVLTRDSIALIDLGQNTNDMSLMVLAFFRYFGQFGNAIFIVCSAFFLTDSKCVKVNKILVIILDSFLISIICGGIVLLFGYSMSISEILKLFFPITTGANWFISCYVLLYVVHPYLNLLINNMQKRQYRSLCIGLFALYSMTRLITKDLFYYNDFIGFVSIYLFTGYYKKYLLDKISIKVACKVLFLSCISFAICVVVNNFIGLRIPAFSNRVMCWLSFIAPFFIITAFSLFHCLYKTQEVFSGPFVTNIAGLSLIFYLIHENISFRNYVRISFFEYMLDSEFTGKYGILCVVLLLFLVQLTGGLVLANIYNKTFGKITNRLSTGIQKLFNSD